MRENTYDNTHNKTPDNTRDTNHDKTRDNTSDTNRDNTYCDGYYGIYRDGWFSRDIILICQQQLFFGYIKYEVGRKEAGTNLATPCSSFFISILLLFVVQQIHPVDSHSFSYYSL